MAKILLVEDDSNLREIYGARLEAEGYEITVASDGEEALATAVRERPDLIISDVMMPKISGFDMLDILRSTPETKNVKVIVMTALSQDEDRKRGEELGADKYIVKSQVTLDDVVTMVRDLLGATGQSAQSAPATQTSDEPTSQPDPASPQPQQDFTQQADNQSIPAAVAPDDPAALVQEVQEFVATSPLMGGAPQQPQSQPDTQSTTPQAQPPVGPPALG